VSDRNGRDANAAERRARSTAEWIGVFLLCAMLAPIAIASAFFATIAFRESIGGALVLVAIATLSGLPSILAFRDRASRSAATAGAAAGIGVCVLAGGACYVSLAEVRLR